MKKLIVMVAAGALALALVGCGSDEAAPETNGEANDPVVEQAQQQQEPEGGEFFDFAVEIGGCTVTQDYNGNPAIVVEFTWTNVTDENQIFDVAVPHFAYQNGVQLDYISVDGEEFDTDASMKNVQPGTTQTVWIPYAIEDMSEVTIEVGSWTKDWMTFETTDTKTFALE